MPKLNVLVVAPNRDARETLRDLLDVEGFTAIEASDSNEGRVHLERCENPCVVLLNLVAAPRTGLDFVRLAEHEAFLLRIGERIIRDTTEAPQEEDSKVEYLTVAELIARRRQHQQKVARTLRPLVKCAAPPEPSVVAV